MEFALGFKKATVAVLDEAGKAVASKTYVLEGNGKGGTVSAKISGLESPSTTVSASDGAYHTSMSGVGAPKLDLEVVELTQEQKAAILGHKYEDGMLKVGKDTRAPYCAVILESTDKDGKPVYISLLKGKFTADSVEIATAEADKAAEGNNTTLTGTFETRGDGLAYVAGHEADEAFTYEAFEALVFPAVDPEPAG